MKTKTFIFGLAATLAVGGFILSAKANDRSGVERFRGAVRQRAAEKLELTDSQKAQIKAALKPEKDQLQLLVSRLHAARQELRESIQASQATEATVRDASAKVAAVQADLAVERLKLHGKIAPILTESQKAKIAEFEARADAFITDALERFSTRLEE